jgi:tRNA dimethylallyltransferase
MMKKNKIIIVCGPTATGKSDYAVELAKKIDGEVISADSRQIYKGLDIGSGKITKKEMRGVPHHLLDVASPKRTFSVAQYKKLADKAIKDILSRSKTPILCGGTGFYIDAVIYDQSFPEVKADAKLRKLLSKLPIEELVKKLKNLDPKRLKTIDTKNKVRLIRAIEIASALGFVPKKSKRKPLYSAQWIYLDFPDEVLKQRIHARLFARIRGIATEVRRLHKEGVSWKKLEALGLEYRYGALYVQNKISRQEMIAEIERDSWQYAKRQRTWFKKYAK